jgi:MerR family transcriptional regulator, redox-sensitive transcriptional activator SoxR
MRQMPISQVARQAGLRSSTLRYYERIGILPAPVRTGGQRRYDETVLHRLALIRTARRTGFSLEEIRELFFGFREGTPASRRWRALSRRKIAELDTAMRRIKAMRRVLERLSRRCHCDELLDCGRAMHQKTATNDSL